MYRNFRSIDIMVIVQQRQQMEKVSSPHTRRELLLKKYHLQSSSNLKPKRQPRQSLQFINSNGIVSHSKLILIIFLIVLSISVMNRANNTHWPHVRALTNYFTYYVLQQQDLGIYDRGDNIDEAYIELTSFDEMQAHFDNVANFVENYTKNGFANFDDISEQTVDMEFYYLNGTLIKQLKTFEQFKQIILHSDLRDMLLGLRVLYFQINFGDNEIIDNFKLVFDYEIFSHSLLKLDMSTKYKRKNYQGYLREQFVLRGLEQLVAAVLMISYSLQAKKLYYNEQLEKQFRKNSITWCCSLVFLNFVTAVSRTLSPLCAMLQLLPIFENYDSSDTLTYNFNVNLRYALPTVFRIIVPVYIILSGFILYSMIMYPGDYFDDYITGFFSYFYNNFQYGIYQIFIEIRSRGSAAYALYVILYFYMVLVGSNLIPALFCSLIYQKMAEQDLVTFMENKLGMIVCPSCKQENYDRKKYGFEISINSPRSPYLKSGTKLTHSHEGNVKLAHLYIQQGENLEKSPTLSPILSIKNRHKKVKDLTEELRLAIEEMAPIATEQWLNEQLRKINQTLSHF